MIHQCMCQFYDLQTRVKLRCSKVPITTIIIKLMLLHDDKFMSFNENQI